MKKIGLFILYITIFASLIWADGMLTTVTTTTITTSNTLSAKDKFFDAVKRGDTTYVKSALDSKTNDINETDSNGQTPLIIAVDNQDVNMVLLLVQYKPDINKKDNQGRTAISIAESKGNMVIKNALNSL